jgi:hypothetical protein
LYLLVRVPYPQGGQSYSRVVPLCPRCDVDDPNSQALLAFFAFHSRAEAGAAEGFAALVEEWVQNLPPRPVVGDAAFDADVEAYRRGDFDD